jgi:hypothetical protein
MISILRATTFLALIAIPSLASAQRRINGLVQFGFAPSGSSDPYATTGGGFGRVGILIPFGPEASIEVAGEGFVNPRSTTCTAFAVSSCLPDTPNVAAGAMALSIPLGDPYDVHMKSMSVGGGAYHFSGDRVESSTNFGAELGLQIIAQRYTRAALLLDARVIVIPHSDHGRFWMIPLTAGFRF